MIYSKNGDDGTSALGRQRLDKSDLRFSLLGDIDELSSYIGLLKIKFSTDDQENHLLNLIQDNLFIIAAAVNNKYDSARSTDIKSISDYDISLLEQKIDYFQGICKTSGFVRPGGCELSAITDICRCVTRRVERSLCLIKDSAYPEALKYLNRLSDYFFALARYTDFVYGIENTVKQVLIGLIGLTDYQVPTTQKASHATLEISTRNCRIVSEAIEELANQMKLNVAIAFCDKSGHTVLASSSKGALIISFDCAIRKAYTAVALKMPTARAQELISPGGIFFGLNDPRLLMIPGGIPIICDGEILGGIGISGGDASQDIMLAEYGARLFG